MEDVAQGAVEQIREKGYAAELFGRGIKTVLSVGLAFHGKQVVVKHEVLSS